MYLFYKYILQYSIKPNQNAISSTKMVTFFVTILDLGLHFYFYRSKFFKKANKKVRPVAA